MKGSKQPPPPPAPSALREQGVREIIEAALVLIPTEAAWCQRMFAQNAAGESVPVMDPSAVRFCGDGAIRRAMGITEDEGYTPYNYPKRCQVMEALKAVRAMPLSCVNDEYGYAVTVEVMRKAAAAAT